MAFNPEHLVTRDPIQDRNREIAFYRLSLTDAAHDTVMPFMRRLTNIETPQAVYFLPMSWIKDEVLLKKLAKDMVLIAAADAMEAPIVASARTYGFRIAALLQQGDARQAGGDFNLAPFGTDITPSPDTIYTGLQSQADFDQAKATPAMYFSGSYFMASTISSGGKRLNPSHALILELMGAVRKEAEPRTIEALFKRDVTLSFKLLRYINSPWFGLTSRVESVRHALSIIGYQQLLKWLALLAVTAGQGASPALTQSAMVRAKLMELAGAKLADKHEADNLFLTGMLSLLDRIMGAPLDELLARINLPPAVTEALLAGSGRYWRFLQLANACEGAPLDDEAGNFADIDVKAVNLAHLEAIEWATQVAKAAAP